MVRLVFILVLLSVVLLQFLVEHVSSACCGATYLDQCGDGTYGTPCCGHGKCNIFCCHCRGGCRSKKRVFEDMLEQLVEDTKERRQFHDSENDAGGNEDDIQEQREVDDHDYSACKRQCLQGQLILHPQAKQIPDSIVKRGITDDNCKRACAYMKRSAVKK